MILLDLLSTALLCLSLLTGSTSILLFAAGVLLWTLFEYGLHRAAHVLSFLQEDHEHHHEHPLDPSGPSSLLTTVGACGLAWVLWGTGLAVGYAGFLVGYAAFLFVHYGVHHWTIGPEQFAMYRFKMMHTAHHRLDDVNYGVTTTLWDRVFRTYRK